MILFQLSYLPMAGRKGLEPLTLISHQETLLILSFLNYYIIIFLKSQLRFFTQLLDTFFSAFYQFKTIASSDGMRLELISPAWQAKYCCQCQISSLTFYIYYNIFFIKNQKRFFVLIKSLAIQHLNIF